MPILTIETNQNLDAARSADVLRKATTMLSEVLEKPKGAIMVRFHPNAFLLLADETTPAAYVSLKLFALREEQARHLVKTITKFVQTELGVAPDRQFHQLIEMVPALFGWNGDTC